LKQKIQHLSSSPVTLRQLALLLLLCMATQGCHRNEVDGNGSIQPVGVRLEMPLIEPLALAERPLEVVATTTIIGDVAANVAKDAAVVTTLMPRGHNPHSYSPTPRDIILLEDADIILVNGLGLEESLIPILSKLKEALIVPVSAGIEPASILSGNHEHAEYDEDSEHDEHAEYDEHGEHSEGDPHFWWSPLNVISWTRTIAGAYSAADPKHRDVYERNAQAYVRRLENLDAELRSSVKLLPAENRQLLIDHAGIGYFAREYGFEVVGYLIPSISDQAESSVQHIAELTDLLREENLKAIFVGESASRGTQNLAASIAGTSGRPIRVIELLTGSLALAGNRGDTYLDFIRHNTQLIVDGLSGE